MKAVHCPNCSRRMTITSLHCSECDITVTGRFSADRYSDLSPSALDFMETFILARGNITEIEKQLGISYPTVKGKIEKLVDEIENLIAKENEVYQKKVKEREEDREKEKRMNERFKKK